MLNKFLSLLMLISLAGLTACTNANQPTGQSQVRQAPEDEGTLTPGTYGSNYPTDDATGRRSGGAGGAEMDGTVGPAGTATGGTGNGTGDVGRSTTGSQ